MFQDICGGVRFLFRQASEGCRMCRKGNVLKWSAPVPDPVYLNFIFHFHSPTRPPAIFPHPPAISPRPPAISPPPPAVSPRPYVQNLSGRDTFYILVRIRMLCTVYALLWIWKKVFLNWTEFYFLHFFHTVFLAKNPQEEEFVFLLVLGYPCH